MIKKLLSKLGGIGYILFFIIQTLVAVSPFIMIDCNFFVMILLIILNEVFPITSIVFWIWGLVCAITGPQDAWAIIYYIEFVILWIPFFIDAAIMLYCRIMISSYTKKL